METGRENKEMVRRGTLAALAAYAIWGFFPLYWKLLASVDSAQILAHRIVWASFLCLGLMAAQKRFHEIVGLFRDKRFIVVLCAALTITGNWWLYIWVVNSGRIVESALGYYINPLFSVAAGVLFFKEKTDLWTKIAMAVAAAGIGAAAAAYGSLPWTSLALGASFAAYGAIKKKLQIEPLLSLSVETLVVAPVALLLLFSRQRAGLGAFGASGGAGISLLLMLAGLVTAVPLLCFTVAANSISLQRIGFMQYISPSLQLFLGLAVFGEKPSRALTLAFAGVLAAVAIYLSTRRTEARSQQAPKRRAKGATEV